MTTIAAALNDLLNERDLPLDEAVRAHFTDTYRQRTDGTWSDRAGFVEHIAHLRSITTSASIEVLDEVRAADTYADRHVVRVEKQNGEQVVQEVYLFGKIAADGRFDRVEEVTMMLAGDERDRRIGSAR